MTDGSGAVVWAADYLPFGQADVTIGTVENNLRFAGQYFDQETGLHYNYHRYYDPKLGRYLRADPIGLLGGINLYSYVQNNPINLIDPLGLRDLDVPTFNDLPRVYDPIDGLHGTNRDDWFYHDGEGRWKPTAPYDDTYPYEYNPEEDSWERTFPDEAMPPNLSWHQWQEQYTAKNDCISCTAVCSMKVIGVSYIQDAIFQGALKKAAKVFAKKAIEKLIPYFGWRAGIDFL